MCSVWISEQTANISLYSVNRLDFITEVDGVYWALHTESNITQLRFIFNGLMLYGTVHQYQNLFVPCSLS
jgi:hypothetical protein